MTKKKKIFRLRKKPEEPQRKTDIRMEDTIYDGYTLAEAVSWAKRWDIPFESVQAETDYGYCESSRCPVTSSIDSHPMVFVFHRAETDEEFAVRRQHYEQKLVTYRAWETDNKESIAEEQKKRTEKDEEKKEKAAEKERKRMERELAQHEKDAQRLRKKLEKQEF